MKGCPPIRRKNVTNSNVKQSLNRISNEKKVLDLTFDNAVKEFLKHCKIKGLSSETVKFYDKELKQVKRAFVEIDVPLNNIRKINNHHAENFVEYQQELGRAVSTINARLRAIKTFFNFCIRKKYVDLNPFETIQQLKMRHEVGATFTKRQLKRLLDAPDTDSFVGLRDLAIMLTFAHTGIRLTELNALRVQDVSFDGVGAINVQRAKNRYARRIPLTAKLKTVLHAYINERGMLHHDFLFINVENQPLNPRTIQERIKHYGIKTGVNDEVKVSPHAFRRTFCRLKVEAGTNLFVLQRLTGHQSLEILKRYVEIYGKDLEKVIEKGFEDI